MCVCTYTRCHHDHLIYEKTRNRPIQQPAWAIWVGDYQSFHYRWKSVNVIQSNLVCSSLSSFSSLQSDEILRRLLKSIPSVALSCWTWPELSSATSSFVARCKDALHGGSSDWLVLLSVKVNGLVSSMSTSSLACCDVKSASIPSFFRASRWLNEWMRSGSIKRIFRSNPAGSSSMVGLNLLSWSALKTLIPTDPQSAGDDIRFEVTALDNLRPICKRNLIGLRKHTKLTLVWGLLWDLPYPRKGAIHRRRSC